jgi:hypothetical protein
VSWAWLLAAAAVCWNLVSLRALLVGVPYLNDGSIHEQMVRFATAQWRAGHLPLTSWFSFLGEGSPQFLHYQSLPAMVTGAAGGFELLEACEFEFPQGHFMTCNDWRLDLRAS